MDLGSYVITMARNLYFQMAQVSAIYCDFFANKLIFGWTG